MSQAKTVSAPFILDRQPVAEILTAHLDGRIDAETIRSWACGHPMDMAEVGQLSAILPAPAFVEVLKAQMAFSAKKAVKAVGLSVAFSDSGRVTLRGFSVNPGANGDGVPLALFPRQISALIDAMPLMLQATLYSAEESHAPTALAKVYNPAFDAGRKANQGANDLRKAGVAKFIDVPHPRAGKTVADWSGCDKPATIAKLRAALEALKPIAAAK